MKNKTKKLLTTALATSMMLMAVPAANVKADTSLKGCKGVPTNMYISSDSGSLLNFSCSDNCGVRSEKVGNASSSIGGFSVTSDVYHLTFDVPGTHVVTVTDASGKLIRTETYEIADGHNYGNPTERQKVTCVKDGTREYTCLNCGDKKEETVLATGHSFGEWILSTPPTALAKGKERRECQICGKKEYNSVAKLEASVSLSKEELTLKVGKSATLEVGELVKGDYVLKWKNSNPKVASFGRKGGKDCTVKAKKAGKTKITVVTGSGCKATCVVTVK